VRSASRKLSWDKDLTRELFIRYNSDGDQTARDELAEMYLNLVKYLANRFRNRGEPLDDLIQVGTIGLIKAIDRFEPDRGWEFTTYATPTITGEIKRYFRDKGWAIRVPRRLQELSFRVSKAIDSLTQRLQRTPTVEEIAASLEVSADDVLEALESAEAYNSVPLEADGDREDKDPFSILDHVGEIDSLMSVVEDRTTLSAALKRLPAKQQQVLYLRFFEGLTQSEIAGKLDLSQMQVSRVLRRSLETLRRSLVPEPGL
jgi:RNA polymerase sigma-B factor